MECRVESLERLGRLPGALLTLVALKLTSPAHFVFFVKNAPRALFSCVAVSRDAPEKSHDIGEMASRAITETKIVIIDPKQPRNASISGGLDATMNREKSLSGHFQKQKRDHQSLRPLLRGTRSFPPMILRNSSDVIYLISFTDGWTPSPHVNGV